jgi:hypothetical protein
MIGKIREFLLDSLPVQVRSALDTNEDEAVPQALRGLSGAEQAKIRDIIHHLVALSLGQPAAGKWSPERIDPHVFLAGSKRQIRMHGVKANYELCRTNPRLGTNSHHVALQPQAP